MISAGYRAVFFDVGDTLLTGPPWVERTRKALEEVGLSVDPPILEAAAAQGWAWLERYKGSTRTVEEEMKIWPRYYRFIVEALGLKDHDGKLADHLFNRCFWTRVAVLFPEALETVNALRARGLRLGLISNAPPSMQQALDRLDLTPRFDAIVISDVAGVSKPDPAIYRMALEALGAPAHEAIFVDDLEPNVRAADALGMTGLLIDRTGRYPDAACRRITDLRQILALLP